MVKVDSMDPRFDRIFVVTYGRSGSTLLQGLLNAISGYRIYGENAGFMFKLQESYEALLFAHTHLANARNDNESQPWFGSSRYDEESVTLEFRRFIDRMLFRPHLNTLDRVFGFKEIRFNEVEHEKIDKYLQFVLKIYPKSAIIFNTRNIADVLKSGWWRINYWPGLPKQLSDFHTYCKEYATRNSQYAVHLSYDDLILGDRKEVGRLLDFLGESLDSDQIDRVFRGSHSYENRTITSYMAGRFEYITIEQPDWWRSNIDEFKIEIDRSPAGHLVITGVFLPAIGSNARLSLGVGAHRIDLVGTRLTPKIESLFLANPAAGQAGFEIEAPASDLMYLFGSSGAEAETIVGLIHPRRVAPPRSSGPETAPGKGGAAKG